MIFLKQRISKTLWAKVSKCILSTCNLTLMMQAEQGKDRRPEMTKGGFEQHESSGSKEGTMVLNIHDASL